MYINGVPVYGPAGISLSGQKLSSIERKLTVALSSGRNSIQVSVLNDRGAESQKAGFEIEYTGMQKTPDLYVLAIGVSQYLQSQYNLTYAAKDATEIGRIFEKQQPWFCRCPYPRFARQSGYPRYGSCC